MARLVVQHCILATTVRQYGSRRTSDLLGVDYFFDVPVDTEFPRRIPRLELFVRFFATSPKRTRLLVTITHLDATSPRRQPVYRNLFDLPGVSDPGSVVFDRTFKLHNVVVPAEGRYEVRIARRRRRPWQARRTWEVLGREYFQVRRV